jgi:mRNA interferase MazF
LNPNGPLSPGDLVWVEFDPAFGYEQSGRRPALVVSGADYNEIASFVLVCPITRSIRPWPFKVELGAGKQIEGFVIVDQVKSIDKRRVVSSVVAHVDSDILTIVLERLALLFGFPAPTESASKFL